jgi:hypothetical protein
MFFLGSAQIELSLFIQETFFYYLFYDLFILRLKKRKKIILFILEMNDLCSADEVFYTFQDDFNSLYGYERMLLFLFINEFSLFFFY